MERFWSSPKSPMTDTPICDSDEEIFFGPVTEKELQKATKLQRRTQLFFPTFNWKPSVSPLARECESPSGEKDASLKAAGTGSSATEEYNEPYSADSLETPSFVTLSDNPEDSSKAEFWSARSGDSSQATTQFSLNKAIIDSRISNDSLDSESIAKTERSSQATTQFSLNKAIIDSRISDDSLDSESISKTERRKSGWSSGNAELGPETLDAPILCVDISADSLDGESSTKNIENRNNSFSKNIKKTGMASDQPLKSQQRFSPKKGKTINETYSASESSQPDNSVQCLSSSPNTSSNHSSSVSANPFATTYEVLPGFGNNMTYTAGSSCASDQDGVKTDLKPDISKSIAADTDGGYLSILSEAALFHAAQAFPKSCQRPHVLEDSSSTTESLEDRFKDFGIGAAELEDQQLSNSIMYQTGRESNVISSETETNTFYTGRSTSSSSEVPSGQTTGGSLGDISSISSLTPRKTIIESGTFSNVNTTNESQGSGSDVLQRTDVLNLPIQNETLGSAGLALQDTSQEDSSYQKKIDETQAVADSSSSYVEDSSDISGVHELHSTHGEQANGSTHEQPLMNDSGASSYAGDLNDTLEEYEMMMKYGVDYILGKKGNKKKDESDDDTQNMQTVSSPMQCGTQSGSPYKSKIEASLAGNISKSSPVHRVQNSCLNPLKQTQYKSVSSSPQKPTAVQGRKILSPLRKQVYTPVKPAAAASSLNGNSLKSHTKLPRVASITPSKMSSTLSKVPQTPPQQSKLLRPVTPSSETKLFQKTLSRPMTPSSEMKSGIFKKPPNPAIQGSRIPKSSAALTPSSKSSVKVLEKIQSPVGAYIHNTPSPVLVTNVKAKPTDLPSHEKEMHARALWRSGELKSSVMRFGGAQVPNAENMNPNVGCGLPAVKYTKAPCIKLDETSKIPMPRGGEKITKLMEAPSPQVIKHEGRLRVKCGSPQLAAKMQSMADSMDDSVADFHSTSGDISVCVTQQACRTNTLGH